MSNVVAGLSSFVLASPFTDDSLGLLPGVKAMGYDLIEICVEDTSALTAPRVRQAVDDAGLKISIGGAFGLDRDVSHDSDVKRQEGIDYIKWCVEFAAEVGAKVFGGPMYSAVGKTRMLSDEARAVQRGWAVTGLQQAADFAQDHGVKLAIEPLNRFETDLVNTVEQAVELCDLIGRSNVGLALDTFHMNIEEKDMAAAIALAGPKIFNFQISENDRGTPGSGHIPWTATFAALKTSGYQGPVVVESFLPNVVEIARAVSLWRPVAPSMDELARDSLAFIRRECTLS